jgi:uncharacterized membrane protein YfcA
MLIYNPFITLTLAGLIIFFAFFIRSLTGFGGALISVPLLALLFDLKFAVPFEAIFDIGVSFILIGSVYRQINKTTLLPLLMGALIGTTLGSAMLSLMADNLLKYALGVLVILFALNLLRGQAAVPRPIGNYWGGVAGGIGGFCGSLFGTNGPPFVIYLSYKLKEKETLRASLIGLFAVDGLWRFTLYAYNGLITPEMSGLALVLMPALCLGVILGHKIHLQIDETRFRQIVAGILIISGSLLLIS